MNHPPTHRALPPTAPAIPSGTAASGGGAEGGALDFELTPAQAEVWIRERLYPGQPLFALPVACSLFAAIDAHRLRRALQTVVDASDALRSVLRDGPCRRVLPSVVCTLDEVDLGDAELPDEALAQWLRHRSQTPPDGRARGFDFALIRLSPRRFVWYLSLHAAIADERSVDLLIRRVAEAYASGACASFPSLAAWQRRCATPHPPGHPPQPAVLAEPADPLVIYGRATARQTTRGHRVSHVLEGDRYLALREAAARLCPQADISDAMRDVVTTVLIALLARIGPNRTVGVGVRRRDGDAAFAECIGPLSRTAAVRLEVDDAQTCTTLLGGLRAALDSAAETAPPYDASVVWHVPLHARFEGQAIARRRVACGHQWASLQVEAEERADHLVLHFDMREDAVEKPQRADLPRHFQRLLDGMVADADQSVYGVDILSPQERHHILVEANRSEVAWSRPYADVPAMFEAMLADWSERPAVTFGHRTLTYRALESRANQLARYLRGRRAGPETLIGLFVERSLDMVVGMLGIMKAGAAIVPLETTFPRERLAMMIEDCEMPLIITHEAMAGRLPPSAAEVICLDADADAVGRCADDLPARLLSPLNLAYVLFTSGSTGRPKGVAVSHGAVVNFLNGMQRAPGMHPGDTILSLANFTFDLSVLEIYWPLSQGARTVIVPREVTMDAWRLSECLAEYAPTFVEATPATWHMLVESGWEGLHPLTAISAGEVLSPQLAHALLQRCDRLLNGYGPTEATVLCALHEVRADDGPVVPVGGPMANYQLYVVDGHGLPVPPGVPGELLIGGAGLARGYLNRPDLTAEKFIHHPFSRRPGARVYRSGDLARQRLDGTVEILGRIDHQIKIRGYRIEPGEVESVLEKHAAVGRAVVTAREDAPGERRLVGYVTLVEGARTDSAELCVFAQRTLPEYMVPSVVVILDAFPLNANGKVERRALPTPPRADAAMERVEPRDLLEYQLARNWEEVLDVRPIGVRDDFMALGGTSLKAVRLLERIECLTRQQLPLNTVLQARTVEQQARLLRDGGCELAISAAVPLQPSGTLAPFFCVHALIGDVCRDLARHLGRLNADRPVYGLQPRGLDGRNAPLTRIEDMAAHYLAEVRRIQPHGPYFLGGYCFGGAVAYEMARQLEAVGEPVAALVIIDGEAVNPSRARLGSRARHLAAAPFRLLHHFRDVLAERSVRAGWSTLRRKLRMAFVRARAGPDGLSDRDVADIFDRIGGTVKWPQNYLRIARVNYRAWRGYVTRPYGGRVVLIRRVARLHPLEDASWGWGDVAAAVDVVRVPGGHEALMNEPMVAHVAAHVEAALARAPHPPA